ncbi:hypothetical protein EV175_001707 [Coemansia sp. RSA 1933]|nr:hypothetical protein EV175_001707 [Coemansia sp. RSA 1933]
MIDYSLFLRPIFNWVDDLLYKAYRPAGCFVFRKDGGSKEVGEQAKAVLRLKVLKGKDVPHNYPRGTSTQYVVIRIGSHMDYCFPVANTSGEPRFAMTSYFQGDLFPDALVEITVYNDGKYRDSAVGRVTVPVKELHDVRDYHGWVALSRPSSDDPAGFVYLDSRFRTSVDGEYVVLEDEFKDAMCGDGNNPNKGHQLRRMKQKRHQARAKARRRRYVDDNNNDNGDQKPGTIARLVTKLKQVFRSATGRSGPSGHSERLTTPV